MEIVCNLLWIKPQKLSVYKTLTRTTRETKHDTQFFRGFFLQSPMKKEGPSPYGLNQLCDSVAPNLQTLFLINYNFTHNLKRMNVLQFNLDEDLGYSPISPDVIDISSESGVGVPRRTR